MSEHYSGQHNTDPVVSLEIMCHDRLVIEKLRVAPPVDHPFVMLVDSVACVDDFIKRLTDD